MLPLQSFVKLTIDQSEDGGSVYMSRKNQVEQLQNVRRELFDKDVLHVLNGQAMYEEFIAERLMGDSDYVPFNEAMCVHATTTQVFDNEFIQTRASGHHESVKNYIKKVIAPLDTIFKRSIHISFYGLVKTCFVK